jgi:hypothetical protein
LGCQPGKSHYNFYNRTENKKSNKLQQGRSFRFVYCRDSNKLLLQFSEFRSLILNDHIHENLIIFPVDASFPVFKEIPS